MARIRSIKIGFFKNEHLCELSPLHRLLFAGLWVLADKAGRLEDRPKRIKIELFPYDDLDVDQMLADLVAAGFVHRYEVRGGRYILVIEFLKHQRPHHKEVESILPPPPRASRSKNGHASVMHDVSMNDDGDSGPGEHGDDPLGSGSWDLVPGSGNGDSSAPPRTGAAEPLVPPLLVFPVVGRDRKEWPLTAVHVDEWQSAYPNLDIVAQCKKALAWVNANPSKKKTGRGMPAFLVRWFNTATDRGEGRPGASRPIGARAQTLLSRSDEQLRIQRELRDEKRRQA